MVVMTKVGPSKAEKLARPSGKQFVGTCKEPEWKCGHCGTKGVWANRLSCHICNAPAPRSVVAAANKAAKAEVKEPTASKKAKAEQKQTQQLKAEVKSLRAKLEASSQSTAPDDDDMKGKDEAEFDADANEKELKRIEGLLAAIPEDSKLACDVGARAAYSAARSEIVSKLHENQPPAIRQYKLSASIKAKEAAVGKLAEKLKENKEEVKTLQEEAVKIEAEAAKLRAEIVGLQQTLASVVPARAPDDVLKAVATVFPNAAASEDQAVKDSWAQLAAVFTRLGQMETQVYAANVTAQDAARAADPADAPTQRYTGEQLAIAAAPA